MKKGAKVLHSAQWKLDPDPQKKKTNTKLRP